MQHVSGGFSCPCGRTHILLSTTTSSTAFISTFTPGTINTTNISFTGEYRQRTPVPKAFYDAFEEDGCE